VLPAWAVLEAAWRARSLRRCLALAAAVALGFAVAFFVACPQCVLRADLMLAAIERHRELSTTGAPQIVGNHLVPSLGWLGLPWAYQLFAALPFGLGWPLWLTALAGVGLALRRRTLADRLTLVWLATYFAAVGSSRVTYWRYLLPLFPGLALLAGRWFAEPARRPRLRVAAFAACWAYSFALALSQVDCFSYEQQKAVARWIAAALPATAGGPAPQVAFPLQLAAHVGLDRVLVREGLRPLPAPAGGWLRSQPEVFVLPEWIAIGARRDSPDGPAARDVERLAAGTAGYREVLRLRSGFLQDGVYTRLDPAFAGDLWQGEAGFTVYLRDDRMPAGRGASPEG
jgi:hypothetical protein